MSAPLAGLFEVGQEPMAAAYWHALGAVDGATRRLRVGTVLLGSLGATRSATFAMEWEPHVPMDLEPGDPLPPDLPGFGATWWLAYRFFGQGGGGTGVLHGDWVEREGVGLDALEEPVRELLDAQHVHVALPPLDWQTTPGPQLETEWIMRAPGNPKPTEIGGFVTEIAMLTDPEVTSKGIGSLWVFAFRNEWLEWWRINGDIPCSLDDVLSNVAIFSSAEVVGVVTPGSALVPDGSTRRAAITTVEFDGQRMQRALVLDDDDGRPKPLGVRSGQPVPVPAAERWLGVTPSHDLQIETESVVQRGGPELGES